MTRRSRTTTRSGFTLIELMIVIAIIAILAAILIPNFVRARSQGQRSACESNLKNLATALETYSTEYEGRYPATLDLLAPNYMRSIPTCPAAGSDTYTAGYAAASNPDAYTVVCSGTNHAGTDLPADYPQYTSSGGLVSQ